MFDKDNLPFAKGSDGALEYSTMKIVDAEGNDVAYQRTWEAAVKPSKTRKLGAEIGSRRILPKPAKEERVGPVPQPKEEINSVSADIRRNWDALPEAQRREIELEAQKQRLKREEVKERLKIFLGAGKKIPDARRKALAWYQSVRDECGRRSERLGVSQAVYAAVVGATSPRKKWEVEKWPIDDIRRFPNYAAADHAIDLWNKNPELEITPEFAEAWMKTNKALDMTQYVGQKRPLREWSPDVAARLLQYNDLLTRKNESSVMYERMINALEILHSNERGLDPAEPLRGNKTYAFYQTIMDPDYDNAVVDVWMIQAAAGRSTNHPKDADGENVKISDTNPQTGYISHSSLDRPPPTKTKVEKQGYNPTGTLYHWIADVINEVAREEDPPMSISDTQALIWYAIRDHGGFDLLPDRLRENPAIAASDVVDPGVEVS